MRERFWCRTLLLACGILLIAASVSAHTLELKDGRLLVGRYVGGTATTIRFSVKGDVQEYPLDQIVSLTFTNDPDADTPPSTSPPADAPPANPPHNEPPPPSSPPPANPPMATTGDQITVPTGTSLLIRMIDSVDSSKNQVGDKFHASLDADLVVNGVVVARRGADVFGRLTTAESAGHIEGKSELRLELTDISINDRLRTVVTGDYSLAGSSRGESSAKRIGGATAGGAILGAILGGGKGAAIGAGVGAGAATTVQATTRGEQVKVPSETLLEFHLDRPLVTEPSHAGPR
ncbi:MAG TPA: hypothetical protein VN862_02850 [Candidatus Acidoferrales bacterium]|nr:hypothetical protein [Candidatus Acidoferrales bacterium]